jgi:hypothetical protein
MIPANPSLQHLHNALTGGVKTEPAPATPEPEELAAPEPIIETEKKPSKGFGS